MGSGRDEPRSHPGVHPLVPVLTPLSHRRTFLQAVSSDKVRSTNLNCSVIADVRHDGSEPCVDVLFGGFAWGVEREGAAGHPRALSPGTAVLLSSDAFVSPPGDGHRLIMRGAHLTAQEMLIAFATHIQARGTADSGDKSGPGAER